MKKWIFSLVLLLLVVVITTPKATEANTFPIVKKVATATVTIKSEASENSKSITSIKKDTLVIVTATKDHYSKVNYNGKTGYLPSVSLTEATPTPKIVNRTKGQVIKSSPTTSYKTITTLAVNTVVEDYGKVNDSHHLIQYGSVIGFAHKNTMKVTKQKTMYINSHNVKIFAAANKTSATRGTLSFATAVKVHTTIGSWAYVTVGTQRGYIAKSFLSSTQPVLLKTDKVSYASIQSKIRYSTTIRDLKGNAVKAYFIAINDSYRKATEDDLWAGVTPGDDLYYGTYKIGLQQNGSRDVYMQSITFSGYTYNKTRQLVYLVKGKTSSDTDLLGVSQVASSAGEVSRLFYLSNGKLNEVVNENGYFSSLRLKSIGHQNYQSASYVRAGEVGYIFYTETFNPTTGTFQTLNTYKFLDDLYEVGIEHARKFSNSSSYYVK